MIRKCSICGKYTDYLCSDCMISYRKKVAVCEDPKCRDIHEKDKHENDGVMRIKL